MFAFVQPERLMLLHKHADTHVRLHPHRYVLYVARKRNSCIHTHVPV